MTIVLDKVLEDQVTQGVNALVQTVAYNVKLVRGIDSEIKDLTSDIETFSARLVEASKNSWASDHHVLRVVVKKFRTVVNEAQDTIADYVALKEKHGDNNAFSKSLDKIPFCGKIHDYASEIQSLKAKLDKIREDHGQELLYLMTHKINEQNKAAQPTLQLQAQPTVEKVGFKDDLKVIKANILLKASNNFTVIPIVGITGTGKTIFASMIFEDKDIRKKFICHIWIHVAQGFDRKEKFIDILYQISKRTEDISMMTEDVLARKIYEHLEDKKYLVVLDNLRKKDDWDSFKVAFPENSKGSIVMVTTPYGNVVDSYWKSHNLGKLSNEEGWVLLKNNVFGTKGCNDQLLEGIGKEIAKKCNELPLALVVVAGILRQCGNIADWKRVAENPFLEINREGQSYREQVKLSYNDLPHEKLKNCFLYFAYFPIGYEIVVWKLICLWIAEEFIPTIDEWGYTLDTEVEAQKYLNELVNRNLVMVTKRRTDGQIKTCCIPNTFHEFCKSEAARINLFHVMDEGQRLDENTSSIRRLCFHSFIENTSPTHPLYSHSLTANKCAVLNSKHIHSLLLSSLQKSETTSFAQEQLTTIPNAFPLLRVLNIESIMLIDLQPNELYNLHLLRYVAIRSNLNLLPKSFKNLRKLEVLVINTTARALQIDGGIWNMEKLRHVHTNTSAQLPFPPKTHSVRICIRTLSTISPTSCTKEIFSKTPNLQKLGVRGNLAELLEEKHGICLFNNLEMLKNLENLKLYGQYDKVLRLPMGVMHTSRLKKMTLSGTLFEWKNMFILGMLEDLEVLKLDEYAFKGEHWVLSKHYVFKRLQYLRIGRTDLVTWDATEDSFPTLRSLVLRNCNFLERIPDAFANIHTLEVMELFHMSENAVESAKEVTENLKNSGFQLVITSQKISKNNSSRREDLQTAAMRVEIKQAVSERVDRLVHSVACNVEWSRGLALEIKDLTSDIETFNARVMEASINPFASLNVLIVEKFRTVVNEAQNTITNYFALKKKKKHEEDDKAFTNVLVPHHRSKVKSCATEIQSLRTKVNMIRQEHENDLQPLTINPNNVLLSPQKIETPTVFDKVIKEGVEQAVNTLDQTVKDNVVNPVCDIESEINNMTSHIKAFTKNLLKACKNPMANEHRVLRVIVKRFRLLVNEANDAVGKYFAMETKHGQNSLPKSFHKIPFREKVNIYASEIQSISAKVNTIRRDHGKDLIYLQDYKHIHLPPPQTQVAVQHENNIIGFNDDLEAIKVRLEASNDFVIPIVGTAGIGKTTFAIEIFEDPEIRKFFTHCIWVHVSQGFHRKKNFIDILHQISKPTEDFSMISEDQLEAKIKETLENQKYFIVLDDVRQEKDWNSLKAAFPENLNGSKMLVTTRYSNVVDSTRKSHILGGLSNDDGWLVIKNNVFGAKGGYSDPLLQDLGKRIAKHCNGLPLGLLLVSGILRKCRSIDDWQRVAEYPPLLNIWSDGPSIQELVWLSYENLPHVMLKNCLLYFAFFPIGYEIAAWKLIRLWIAEEFIPTIDEWGYPLDVEVEAQKYLNDLVDRNLVRVTKRGADGQIQTCNIHDTLHESFKIKATWTDLFKVLDEGRRLNENISLSRRLCFIHSSTMDIFDAENNSSRLYLSCYNKRRSPLPSGDEHVHSLLLSSSQKSEIHLTPKQLATIPNTFPLLKVLNIESLKFSSLPNELYGLFLLRYLAITGDIDSLPKSFKNLRELETLVIKTTKGRLHINGGIWNMRNLRHVHTNTSTQLPPPPKTAKNSFGGTNIHTLSTISPESCTNEIFEKIPNLQILGVRGDLSDLLEEKQDVCMFNNLQMLCLDNLKLHGNSEKVLKLPMLNKFASKLRKLILSGTLFQWNDMTILGSLEELEVLKLDDNAFCGQRWDLSSDVIFKQLQYLRIGRMNLRTWTAVEESFPVLESLVLRNCIFLENIPFGFANVHSLKVMDLFHVSESAADSARKIGEQRHGKTTVKINGFNLFSSLIFCKKDS